MRNIPSYLPRHKVAHELGVSVSTIKRWEKGGDFPVPETNFSGKDYFYFPEVILWMKDKARGAKK